MPQFVVIGHDGPEGLERRQKHREAHLHHWGQLDAEGKMIYAGPLLNEQGNPMGSLLVFDADDAEEASRWMNRDPYVTGEVFKSYELLRTKQVLPHG